MFGIGKDKGDNEVSEIITGPLNLFYVDRISNKRKNTNKISAKVDITVAVVTDANEEEFRQMFNDFIAENGDYDRLQFPLSVIKNGFYCIALNQQLMVPGQEW
jgi:hypothetical protein